MKTLTLTTLALTAWLLAPSAVAATTTSSTLHLLKGESHLFSTPSGFERVAISDPKVADVRVISNHQLMLQAKAPGATSLFVWTKKSQAVAYDIRVGLDANAVQGEIRSLTSNGGVNVDYNGNAFILGGTAATQAQKDSAEKIAATYGSPVVNLIAVTPQRDQIAIDVKVIELAKSGALNLGLNFGGGTPTAVQNGITQYTFNPGAMNFGTPGTTDFHTLNPMDILMTKLQALENRGEAKMLANPTLVTVDGGTAKFLAGGEIPIPVAQALGTTTIMWKDFGVKLEVTPTLLPDGRVDLKVKPEVSSLDYANGLKQGTFSIPAVKTRQADTRVVLGPKETLMIGGLLDNEQSKSWSLIPGLGNLPIIGELFKSRDFQNNRSELAILVTPRLITPDGATQAPGALLGVEKSLKQDMVP